MMAKGVSFWTAIFYVVTSIFILGFSASLTAMLINRGDNGTFDPFLVKVVLYSVAGLVAVLLTGAFTTSETIAFKRRRR